MREVIAAVLFVLGNSDVIAGEHFCREDVCHQHIPRIHTAIVPIHAGHALAAYAGRIFDIAG